jgi:hypothetical protein
VVRRSRCTVRAGLKGLRAWLGLTKVKAPSAALPFSL